MTRSAMRADSTNWARVDTSVGSIRPDVLSVVVGSSSSRDSAP